MKRADHPRRRPTRPATAVLAVVLAAGPLAVAPPAAAVPEPLDATALGVAGGRSAVLVEVATGQVIAARDADVRRPVASTIKLVTALVAAEALPPGRVVTVGPEVRDVGGASAGLVPGDVVDVDDLLALLLLRSGNDAAVALAVAVAGDEDAFVARMEAALADLGIDAELASASGLDAGDRLSATELATVARAVLDVPRLAGPAGRASVVAADGTVLANRNLLLDRVVGATGLKTGYTEAAGWTLVGTAERDGRRLVAVVLGAADEAERLAVVARLLEHGFTATRSAPTARDLELRTGGGTVRWEVDAGPLTIARGAELTVAWPEAYDPAAAPREVPILVDGTPVTTSAVRVSDPRPAPGTAGPGPAAASAVYAALRAAGAAGLLG